MREHHPFGAARGAGGEQNDRRILLASFGQGQRSGGRSEGVLPADRRFAVRAGEPDDAIRHLENQPGAAILHDGCDPVCRPPRVDRNTDGARQHATEHCHHRLRGFRQHQRHAIPRPDPARAQCGGEGPCRFQELFERGGAVLSLHRDRRRRGSRRPQQPLVQQCRVRLGQASHPRQNRCRPRRTGAVGRVAGCPFYAGRRS